MLTLFNLPEYCYERKMVQEKLQEHPHQIQDHPERFVQGNKR